MNLIKIIILLLILAVNIGTGYLLIEQRQTSAKESENNARDVNNFSVPGNMPTFYVYGGAKFEVQSGTESKGYVFRLLPDSKSAAGK